MSEEPIQAVEVETPKPKWPRTYVSIGKWQDGAYGSASSTDSEEDARQNLIGLDGEPIADAIIAASDEPVKPVVSSIPTAEEMFAEYRSNWTQLAPWERQDGTTIVGFQGIHALVASRVVEVGEQPISNQAKDDIRREAFREVWERAYGGMSHEPYHQWLTSQIEAKGPLVSVCPTVVTPPPSLDPIRAIVEILTMLTDECTNGGPYKALKTKLSALKRSLTGSGE
mgnify:CR=1 FL=1